MPSTGGSRAEREAVFNTTPQLRCAYLAQRLRELARNCAPGNPRLPGQLNFLNRHLPRLPPEVRLIFWDRILKAVANKYRDAKQGLLADALDSLHPDSCPRSATEMADEAAFLDSLQGSGIRLRVHATRRRLADRDAYLATRIAAGCGVFGLRAWLLQRDDLRMSGDAGTSARLLWLAGLLDAVAAKQEHPAPFPADPALLAAPAALQDFPRRNLASRQPASGRFGRAALKMTQAQTWLRTGDAVNCVGAAIFDALHHAMEAWLVRRGVPPDASWDARAICALFRRVAPAAFGAAAARLSREGIELELELHAPEEEQPDDSTLSRKMTMNEIVASLKQYHQTAGRFISELSVDGHGLRDDGE